MGGTRDAIPGQGRIQAIERANRYYEGLLGWGEIGQCPLEHQLVACRVFGAKLQESPHSLLQRGGTVSSREQVVTRFQLLIALTKHGVVDRVLRVKVRVQRGGLHPDSSSQVTQRNPGQTFRTSERPRGLKNLDPRRLMA